MRTSLLFLFLFCATATAAYAAPPVSVDTLGDVGVTSSLALDAAGNPVISYRDSTNQDLKVVHCNDPDCAGGDESIQSPDTAGFVGLYTSLVLDAAGNPVISYLDNTNGDLKVMHCNDPDCAGGNESIQSPDTAGLVGYYSSLKLDAAGNPVVAYYDLTNGDLKLLHCNDVNCAPGGDTVERVDSAGNVGTHASLVLDAIGHPVISYFDSTNSDLKVVHCDIASCADGQLSYARDTTGVVGMYTSIALDATGSPVVSYYDASNGDLKLLNCNTPSCATGGTIEQVDSIGVVGLWTSLALDQNGWPVISYLDATNSALKVVHCDIDSCADGQISVSVDNAGDVGSYSSLVLDAAGRPVVSYYDATLDVNGDLKLVHCDNPTCAPQMTSITLLNAPGGPNGWYVTGASIQVSALDPDVVQIRCALDPAIVPETFDDLPSGCAFQGSGGTVTADGFHSLYAASRDDYGLEDYPVSVSFKIDQADPTITYTNALASYNVDRPVNIRCTAADATSGIATHDCANITGLAASFGLGTHSYSATATDNAGHSGSGSVSFTVRVTNTSLCNLTLRYGVRSDRYRSSTPAQRSAFVQQIAALCADSISQITPLTPPSARRALLLIYRRSVFGLAVDDWLTSAQALELVSFSNAL